MKLKAFALFLLAILHNGARLASYVIIGLPTDLCGVGERTKESWICFTIYFIFVIIDYCC